MTQPVHPQTLRIGFIGAGSVAQNFVMKHLRGVPGAEMFAAADVHQGALDKVRAEYNIPHTFTDYRRMLTDLPAMEAVCVCTPNGLHAEHTIAALEAGRHVMVEKPMAMNAAEAQRMLDAARRTGKHLVIGFQHRFEPRSQFIRRQMEAGAFGHVLYVRVQALRRRGIPSWGVFGRKDLQGGGPLIDIGVHLLETAHYLIGAPRPLTATANVFTYLGNKEPAAMQKWGPWDHKTYTVEDLAVGMIRFETGTMLSIESSFAAHIEKDLWSITIMGEKGGASWDSSQVFTDVNGYLTNQTAQYIGQWDHFEYKMRHFVEVCRDGRFNEVPGEHGLMVQKMLDGIYASAERGHEVVIE